MKVLFTIILFTTILAHASELKLKKIGKSLSSLDRVNDPNVLNTISAQLSSDEKTLYLCDWYNVTKCYETQMSSGKSRELNLSSYTFDTNELGKKYLFTQNKMDQTIDILDGKSFELVVRFNHEDFKGLTLSYNDKYDALITYDKEKVVIYGFNGGNLELRLKSKRYFPKDQYDSEAETFLNQEYFVFRTAKKNLVAYVFKTNQLTDTKIGDQYFHSFKTTNEPHLMSLRTNQLETHQDALFNLETMKFDYLSPILPGWRTDFPYVVTSKGNFYQNIITDFSSKKTFDFKSSSVFRDEKGFGGIGSGIFTQTRLNDDILFFYQSSLVLSNTKAKLLAETSTKILFEGLKGFSSPLSFKIIPSNQKNKLYFYRVDGALFELSLQ